MSDDEEVVDGEVVEDAGEIETLPAVPEGKVGIRSKDDIDTAAMIKCADCYIMQRCPFYEEDATCKLDVKVQIRTAKDLVDVLAQMLEMHAERLFRQMFMEKVDGGVMDPMLTGQMEAMFGLANRLKDLMDDRDSLHIDAKGKGIVATMLGGLMGLKEKGDVGDGG